MPSWNEKPHVTPTVNVNLATCDCSDTRRLHCRASASADGTCPTKPALIPCPIPRSFEAVVRLGECKQVGCVGGTRKDGHAPDCPARPIRVSCSISGETWAESEVADVIDADRNTDIGWSSDERAKMLAACRDRLALVKALVTGGNHDPENHPYEARVLFTQRDAVFAALAAQALFETEMLAAQQATVAAIASPRLTASETSPEDRPSAQALAVYVEHLIEQVGVLS